MNFGLVNNACRSAPTRFPPSPIVRYSVLLAAVLDIESNDGEGLTDYTFNIRTIEQPLKLLNCFGGLGNVHMDCLGRMMGARRGDPSLAQIDMTRHIDVLMYNSFGLKGV